MLLGTKKFMVGWMSCVDINLLAPELFFEILTHSVYKM